MGNVLLAGMSAPAQFYQRDQRVKGYHQLLFRAQKGLQSAELNEIQQILGDNLSRVASMIAGNFSFFSDGAFHKQGETNQYIASGGSFNYQGAIIQIPPNNFAVAPDATTTYGVAIKREVISELYDPAMLDPAVGARNFNEPGAHRLKITGRWVEESEMVNVLDEDYFPQIWFLDGDKVPQPYGDSYVNRKINNTVARADYHSNGSYRVYGMQARFIEQRDVEGASVDPRIGTPPKEYLLEVTRGISRVQGYEIFFETPRNVIIEPALDTREVANEPINFTTNKFYPLRWGPIAEVTEINGIREVTVTITHGNFSGAQDLLPNTPVVSILEVKQGATTYVEGTSWTQAGDYISWAPAGPEPAPGSQYTVKFRYSEVIPAVLNANRDSVQLTGFASGTVVYIDYSHFVPRVDSIYLTRDGYLDVSPGVPNYLEPVAQPVPSLALPIAEVYVVYGKVPQITRARNLIYRLNDMQRMDDNLMRLNNQVARLALMEDVQSTDNIATKLGQFVDPFKDDDLRDAGVAQTLVSRDTALSLGINWTNIRVPGNDGHYQLPKTEKTYLNQPAITSARRVNRFIGVAPPPAMTTVTPRTFRWIADTIYEDIFHTHFVAVATFPVGSEMRKKLLANGWIGPRGDDRNIPGEKIINGTTVEDRLINATVPPQTLAVTGTKFNGGEQVQAIIDGRVVATLTANAAGAVSGNITTPVGMLSGSKLIRLRGVTSGVIGDTVFRAEAISREITRDVTQVMFYDPLAQTFTFTDGQDRFVTSIEVPFKVKSPNYCDLIMVRCQLGIPDRTQVVAGPIRIQSAQIQQNAAGTLYTKFTFAEPVLIPGGQEHAFILITPDGTAQVQTAVLGEYDTIAKRWVTTGAYDVGVLLESSNLSTWTPLQDVDLTFRLNVAQYQVNSWWEHAFPAMNVTNASDLMLLAGIEVPERTVMQWTVTLVGDNNRTMVLEPYEAIQLPARYTGQVILKVKMRTSIPWVSPTVDGMLYLQSGNLKASGEYVSRVIPVPTGTPNVKLYLDIFEPAGTTITVYMRNPADTAWVALTRDTANAINLGDGVVEMPFTAANLFPAGGSTKIRIVMTHTDPRYRPIARNLRSFFH